MKNLKELLLDCQKESISEVLNKQQQIINQIEDDNYILKAIDLISELEKMVAKVDSEDFAFLSVETHFEFDLNENLLDIKFMNKKKEKMASDQIKTELIIKAHRLGNDFIVIKEPTNRTCRNFEYVYEKKDLKPLLKDLLLPEQFVKLQATILDIKLEEKAGVKVSKLKI